MLPSFQQCGVKFHHSNEVVVCIYFTWNKITPQGAMPEPGCKSRRNSGQDPLLVDSVLAASDDISQHGCLSFWLASSSVEGNFA